MSTQNLSARHTHAYITQLFMHFKYIKRERGGCGETRGDFRVYRPDFRERETEREYQRDTETQRERQRAN